MQFGIKGTQSLRSLKVKLCGHCKKFRRVLRSVGIDRSFSLAQSQAQMGQRPIHDPLPPGISGQIPQDWHAINGSTTTVKLMGKFMQNNILPGPLSPGAGLHGVPGQHHTAPVPGLTNAYRWHLLDHTARQQMRDGRDKCIRVEENRLTLRKVAWFVMQLQATRLGRHEDAHDVGDFQAATAYERLFVDKDLNAALQAQLQVWREATIPNEAALKDLQPRFRKWLFPKCTAA
ncbi:hypothetical protein GCM10008949_25320 [Deinococcus humi]|nr:hypothetical protein GCM10008949_25320 [Deinococcus humi]